MDMWLPNDIIAEVEAVVRIHYIDATACKVWNEHRREGELRLLTGWCWTARNGRDHRQGFKTRTVAMRDAWYALVQHRATPAVTRARLRVVRAA
jgi:hypothetical protein